MPPVSTIRVVDRIATGTTPRYASEFRQGLTAEAPDLILQGGDLVLEWNTVPPEAEFWVFSARNEPFFAPQVESPFAYRVHMLSDTTWSASSGIAEPDTNWTYQLITVDGSANELARLNRAG